MSRGHGRDEIETERMHFADTRSKIDRNGKMFLYGEDWKEQQITVLTRDSFTCQLCRKPFDLDYDVIDTDHIVKRSEGGSDDMGNLRSVHRACHDARHPEFQTQFSGRIQ